MRLSLSRRLAVAAVVTGLLVATAAQAQDFATVSWTPITRNNLNVSDAADPGASESDVVGTLGSAAIYVASDVNDLYFRIKVNDSPTVGAVGAALKNTQWGCAIDTNGTLTNYEYLAILNGSTELVHWRHNAVINVANNVPAEVAEVAVATFPRSTNARVVDAATLPTPFSGNADWFVEFAVPWSTIRAGGNGAPGVLVGTPMRFVCGTGPNNAFHIGTDQASSAAPPNLLDATFSDSFVCGDTGCLIDTDGDGVPNSVEVNTDNLDKDTDNDGINDNLELSAGAGPWGPYTAPDTDGDGVIDALDGDSDNDCARDSAEGVASFRNPALPNGNPSSNCAGATPFCRTTTGTCLACNGNNGSGTSAACPFAATPACQLAGALLGRCTQCTVTETFECGGATPACQRTTGACAACNGDNGAATTAVCPDASVPACNLAGDLAGKCTQCTATNGSLCLNPTPACDTSVGTCAACNGDRGGGGTRACPATATPYCNLTGVDIGACGKCTLNTDCGDGHTGPTCDVATGACIDKDSDGDGLNDSVEKLLGTNFEKKDSDNDGIEDLVEVTPPGGGATAKVDTDLDGVIDALDTDSDNDGIPDKDEGVADVDNDFNGNYRDADDDGDGIPTNTEVTDTKAAKVSEDVDGDGKKNWYDDDADGDGITDRLEGRADTDMDGVPDYLDAMKVEPPKVDAGPGFVPPPPAVDAGIAPVGPDQGVLEGTGLLCSSSRAPGSPMPSWLGVGSLLAAALAFARRSTRDPRGKARP